MHKVAEWKNTTNGPKSCVHYEIVDFKVWGKLVRYEAQLLDWGLKFKEVNENRAGKAGKINWESQKIVLNIKTIKQWNQKIVLKLQTIYKEN